MNGRKIGLVALVAGTIIFTSGLVNNFYRKARMNNSKEALNQRVVALEENPESSGCEEAKIMKLLADYNFKAKKYIDSIAFSESLALAGLGIAVAGYVLRHGKVDISVSKYIDWK